jgi:hypothetical protein
MKKPIDRANLTAICTYSYDRRRRVVSILEDGIEKLPGGLFTRPAEPLSEEQWARLREELRAEWLEAMAKPDITEGGPSSLEGI